MFDFIIPPLVVGIICAGIYGLFELFVRKQERLALIEKLSDKLSATDVKEKLTFPIRRMPHLSFNSLKTGLLLTGIGLGLLVGFSIMVNVIPNYPFNGNWHETEVLGSIVYGASVLLFGGIGLIVAFVIEMKMANKKKED